MGFIPTQMNGCVLWVRADQGIIMQTGVSEWKDLSGQGNHLFESLTGNQPGYILADPAYNGQSTLTSLFASNTAMSSLTTVVLPQPYTWFCVGENDDSTHQGGFVGSTTAAGVVYQASPSQEVAIYAGSTVFGGSTPVASKCCIAAVFNGTNSAAYVNASNAPQVTGSAGSTGISSNLAIFGASGAPNTMTGKLAEAVLYQGALTQPQISFVFQYFAARYAPGAWS